MVLRNKGLLESKIDNDIPLRLIDIYNLKPKKVIELGCSNGWRLNEIQKKSDDHILCVGIEPSSKAINDGNLNYPDLLLKKGLLSNVPVDDEFHLVIVNFVLHWIDRKLLLKVIFEIDRLVIDDGYLILGDFYPDFPQKRRYHHVRDKVYTWKTFYQQIFLSANLYKEIGFLSYNHDDNSRLYPITKAQSRGFCSLLKKSCEEYYFEV